MTKQSVGASIVENILRQLPGEYKTEVELNGLADSDPLRVDFVYYAPEGGTLYIEYDGKCHFENTSGRLNDIQRKDSIKNSYFKKYNLNILRIRYLDRDNAESAFKRKIMRALNIMNDGKIVQDVECKYYDTYTTYYCLGVFAIISYIIQVQPIIIVGTCSLIVMDILSDPNYI